MKNTSQTKSALKTLDVELKELLEEDLKRYKAAQSKNNQANSNDLLAA
jgi:hypothetical protein